MLESDREDQARLRMAEERLARARRRYFLFGEGDVEEYGRAFAAAEEARSTRDGTAERDDMASSP